MRSGERSVFSCLEKRLQGKRGNSWAGKKEEKRTKTSHRADEHLLGEAGKAAAGGTSGLRAKA